MLGNKKIFIILPIGLLLAVLAFVAITGHYKRADFDKDQQTYVEEQQTNISSQTLGVSYKQVISFFEDKMSFSQISDVNGQPRYFGKSGIAMLEIIGNTDDITSTSLIVGFPADSDQARLISMAMLFRYILNITPTWASSQTWIASSLKNLQSPNATQTESTVFGNLKIEMSNVPLGGKFIIVNITHR